MTRFEPQTSGIGSGHSVKGATTTATKYLLSCDKKVLFFWYSLERHYWTSHLMMMDSKRQIGVSVANVNALINSKNETASNRSQRLKQILSYSNLYST